MVIYEVTAVVDLGLVGAFERFMREQHLPELLATGCFQELVFSRSAPGRYRMRYDSPSEADLERYLASHAPGLRRDFDEHFPQGVTLSREVWAAIQRWDVSGNT
jgi:hypothetical protein